MNSSNQDHLISFDMRMDKVTTKRRKHIDFGSNFDSLAHIGGDFTFTLLKICTFLNFFDIIYI